MPNINKLHVDQLLSNVSVKYRNEEYIADRIFPKVPVKKRSDLYRVYARNFRIPETNRANRGIAKEFQFDISTASYILEKHALKDYISDDDKDNYDISDLRADTTEELTDAILRRKEKSVLDLMTTTSWSLNVSLAAANAWNANTTVSNPIPIVDTGAATVLANSGKKVNLMALANEAHIAVKNHVSIAERVKYTSAEISEKMLKSLFGMSEYAISLQHEDTAAEGQASVLSSMWGDSAFLGFKPAKAGPKVPSAGYIFSKPKNMVKRWRVEERESEAIEVGMDYVAKVVSSLSGYLIKDII